MAIGWQLVWATDRAGLAMRRFVRGAFVTELPTPPREGFRYLSRGAPSLRAEAAVRHDHMNVPLFACATVMQGE